MKISWILGLGVLLSPMAGAAERMVSKDASLIQSSLCCGMAADKNFGNTATVDAGSYHHKARALLGFDLVGLTARETISLVVPGSIVGSSPARFTLSLVQEDWEEHSVTFNSAPSGREIVTAEFTGTLRFDVTDLIRTAQVQGAPSISFLIDASGAANLFIPSRENTSGLPAAYLEWN